MGKLITEKGKLDYVKPQARDLGGLPVIYGACSSGSFAGPGGSGECANGPNATSPCSGGGSASGGSCQGGGTNLT